jgi:inhibitor of cysteine peptidase
MRARWAAAVALGLIVCALASACRSPRPAGPVTIGEEEAGERVALDMGQILEVALAANPTTGYTWEVKDPCKPILRQVGEPAFTPQSKLLGAGGVEVLRFQAVAIGKETLTLAHQRPWESAPPLETYSVEVVVE